MNDSINLVEKLALFSEHCSPRTVTRFNGHDVMVVKVQESDSCTTAIHLIHSKNRRTVSVAACLFLTYVLKERFISIEE